MAPECAGLWLEDYYTGAPVPCSRIAAASALEAVYSVATLGLGMTLSLALRCSGQRAAFGERICGIRAVQETSEPVD